MLNSSTGLHALRFQFFRGLLQNSKIFVDATIDANTFTFVQVTHARIIFREEALRLATLYKTMGEKTTPIEMFKSNFDTSCKVHSWPQFDGEVHSQPS
jgi:hypothetical protein